MCVYIHMCVCVSERGDLHIVEFSLQCTALLVLLARLRHGLLESLIECALALQVLRHVIKHGLQLTDTRPQCRALHVT